jgi:fructose-1,6-bisphosphatase/inositol monophosphatase family enzyme
MKEFLSFAETLADASRAIILEAVRKPFDLEIKGDGSPVTAVDQGVEDRLREMIAEAYPDHGIVGEERGASSPERELVWALDPIDGTLPFLAGIPGQGRPTTRNGEPVRARPCAALADALVSTSNPDFYGAADVSALERLKAATRWTVYGGSCMAYAQIASGRIDVGIDVAFDPFDYLALVPVIEGAGGVISDWAGAPLTLDSGDRLIAAGDARTRDQALQLLANL